MATAPYLAAVAFSGALEKPEEEGRMDRDYIKEQEEKCIQECPPGCQSLCPLHLDVRAVMTALRDGDLSKARAVYERAVIFPAVLSRICNAPCRAGCNRGQRGGPVEIRMLEEAVMVHGRKLPRKKSRLRRRQGRGAVIGGGLAGLSAALVLADKGYAVTLFEQDSRLGDVLRRTYGDILDEEPLRHDLGVFSDLNVEFKLSRRVDAGQWAEIRGSFEAVLITSGTLCRELGVDARKSREAFSVTDQPGVFAAGGLSQGRGSPSGAIAEGKSAALSMDRYLQGVSLAAGREGEAPFESCLYTSLEGVEPEAPVIARDGKSYSLAEARQEARRCLDCQCLECVKACHLLEAYESYPRRYVRELSNSVNQFYGVRKTKHMLNACTACGLCGEVCPHDLSMGEICTAGKRELVERGIMPPAIHDFPLQDMIFSNSGACSLWHCPDGAEHLFFPGCQMQALMPDLLVKAWQEVEVLCGGSAGFFLGCCGAPADWAGRIGMRDEVLEALGQSWERGGKPKIIYACTSCRQVLRERIDESRLVSLWEFLVNRAGRERTGLPEGIPPRMAVADSCTARYLPGLQESIRRLLLNRGVEIEELPYNRRGTRCCGFGGLVTLTEPEIGRGMIKARIEESALPYAVYCVMCGDSFQSAGKASYHLLEILFGLSEHRISPGERISYSRRQANRRWIREEMRRRWVPDRGPDNPESWELLCLKLDPGVAKRMEERMIVQRDLQRVIYEAERSGRRVRDPESGRLTASGKPGVVTYWVEYSSVPEGYRIHNAYSHRLEVEG